MSRFTLTTIYAALVAFGAPSYANNLPSTDLPVRMTVTANVDQGKRAPQIEKGDVAVRNGKERLEVTEWTPAQGERAGLDLFFLIDDASAANFGTQMEDLRAFINAQPSTTAIGVGYARNATVEIRQNFTTDHALAAKALRLPLGSPGAYGSAYLSVTDLMQRWPESANRREVVLVTDGIDRAKRGRNAVTNPDVDRAASVAQKTGAMIHTIYFPGVGHWRRNFWERTSGQNGIAKLSDMTGGESFFLGTDAPVSFAPYLDRLQNILDSQYLLTFSAKPGTKAGLQYVTVTTEVAGVDFSTPDAVWVRAK